MNGILDQIKKRRLNTKNDFSYLILLRHAEKELLPISFGDEEIHLTPHGLAQAKLFGDELFKHIRIDQLKTSPVLRCLETARALVAPYRNNDLIQLSILLGDPGVYVSDAKMAATHFQTESPVQVLLRLQREEPLIGLRSLEEGSKLLIREIVKDLSVKSFLSCYMTHDIIIGGLVHSLTNQVIDQHHWFDYLDGVIIIRFNVGCDTCYQLLWRDVAYDITEKIADLL